VDCDHVVSPLPIAHLAVNDGWMRSLSYDRRQGRLEIVFRWNDTRQFWPVSPALFKEPWRGRPPYLVLRQKIVGDKRTRWAYVRTDRKVLVSMLWASSGIPEATGNITNALAKKPCSPVVLLNDPDDVTRIVDSNTKVTSSAFGGKSSVLNAPRS
jgi:hypothetical protein